MDKVSEKQACKQVICVSVTAKSKLNLQKSEPLNSDQYNRRWYWENDAFSSDLLHRT